MAVAEQLIVKGKEQGYLTPDDILQGFPEIDAEPDQIFRIFAAFKEIGIEVTDGEKVFEEVDGRQRSVDELLPEVIERLATVKRKGQQAHIAQELLGLVDMAKLTNLEDAA